ncbi:MAG: amidohydrolase [Clostridiales Family XIII bacterium]|jgi:hippurate hydrolase|nr:amidohydrolase [Clostridiales Family XIII bacterium]
MIDSQTQLTKFRRDLHRIPELDRCLPKTVGYLTECLSALPCEIIPAGEVGFFAFFRGGRAAADAPSIAFRTDMDALPILEENDVEYRSGHEGAMHACGHDGHMSIMLGFASEVAAHLGELDRNVLLVFQGAEETTGGAKELAESGIFERCRAERIYGLHLWPGYPLGSVICRDGDFMASTMVLYIDVHGKSSHIAQYKKGIDALETACQFIGAVYKMEKNEVSPETRRLLRFGMMNCGEANNVVADRAHIEGTLRVYSEDVRRFLRRRMEEIADDICAKNGARFDFSNSDPYPAVINPHPLFADAKRILSKAGFDFIDTDEPLMPAEDFAWYQRRLPGLFFHLGTGTQAQLHSPRYDFDEGVLPFGVRAYKSLLGI